MSTADLLSPVGHEEDVGYKGVRHESVGHEGVDDGDVGYGVGYADFAGRSASMDEIACGEATVHSPYSPP